MRPHTMLTRTRSRTRSRRSPRPAARRTASCTCSRSRARPASSSTLDDFDTIAARTPIVADIKPGGRYVATDLDRAGGVALVARELVAAGSSTETRRRRRPHAPRGRRRRRETPGPGGRRPVDEPLKPTGGLAILRGNLAPDGCVVKLAGHERCHTAGRRASSTRGGRASRRSRRGAIVAGRRGRHPLRGPGGRARHARDARTSPRALVGEGLGDEVALDHRRPLLRRDARADGRPRRARRRGGGPIALVRGRRHDRDRRRERQLDCRAAEAELEGGRRVDAARAALHERRVRQVRGASSARRRKGRRPESDASSACPATASARRSRAEALRVLEALPLDVELEKHPFGGAAIDAVGDAAAARDARGVPRARTPCCSAPSAARSWDGGAVRPEQGLIRLRKRARRLREPASGARSRHRPPRRPRARRRPLLRRARRPRRRHRLRHVRVPPGAGRARRAARVRARAAPAAACRSRSTRRTCSTRRGCGGASSTEVAELYTDVELHHVLVDSVAMRLVTSPGDFDVLADREHVRRHPLGRGGRRDRRPRARGLGEPRRRRHRDLRAGARLRAGHRRARDGESGGDAPLARAAARARARRPDLARAVDDGRRARARCRRRRRISAASRRRPSSATPSSSRWRR